MGGIYTYSFVIPHHNSPQLLERCLHSIPMRDDLEIIVVDDNSSEEYKPVIARPDVKLITIGPDETEGAGKARNVGLKEAQGKWILFADCDDFYKDGFLNVLDKYKDTDLDVLYFNAEIRHSDTLKLASYSLRLNKYIAKYQKDKTALTDIRYCHAPWNKMVKHELITKFDIQFEAILNGNDIFYSFLVGYFAKKIEVNDQVLYVYTLNTQSITHTRKTEAAKLCVLQNRYKIKEFYKYIDHKKATLFILSYWKDVLRKKGICPFVDMMFIYLKHRDEIKRLRFFYVQEIERRKSLI